MVYKLHTSKNTQEIFSNVGSTTGLQPFALSKIAIALSLRQGALQECDFQSDNTGLELSRQTIFSDHDTLFKCLIVNAEGHAISEDDYFPKTVKAHLDRGAKLLNSEDRYGNNLFISLCNLDKSL